MNSLINVLDTICFLPLILLSHCGNSVSFEKYIGFKIFDNHTCTAEASLSTTSVVSSIVKCVMDCGHDDRCKSVFYGEDDGACTLCSEVFNYYAHQPAVANVHTKHLRPLQGSCPEGWLRFQYSCYTLTNASNGFHHDECVTMGAHAIYVESIEEQNFLAKTFKPATGGISLIASLALKPPKKKSGGDQRGNQKSGCSAKCSKYILSRDLFTDAVFYIVICAYLLDQIGRPIFSEGMQPSMEEKGFSQTKVDIQPFIENGGALLGLLLLLGWKKHDLPWNLAVLVAMDTLIGILALHVPEMTLRISDVSEDSFEGQHLLFFFSGACLIVAAVLALISRFVVVRRIDRQQEEAAERIEMEIQNGSRRY
ncbi:hypothetical protein MAR_008172 [Mya arenaria]|uniref:Uncharacterized protein n=1 Tax=Mya arenaria TaxID=6604 RepID=A0ABY7DX75_MYAAR|nr:hypothetical protein MAR_008172 [Mya arenaria]